jgi:hypothetical protein
MVLRNETGLYYPVTHRSWWAGMVHRSIPAAPERQGPEGPHLSFQYRGTGGLKVALTRSVPKRATALSPAR